METNNNAIEFEGKTLRERAIEAAVRFMERHDYEVLEREWFCEAGTVDIVAMQDGVLVFASVTVRECAEGGFIEEDCSPQARAHNEQLAAAFLAATDYVDVQFRFDVISLLVIGSSRAMLRHHINAFG